MTFQARKENIVVQTANGETMVYDLDVDRAYLLNETSAFVWQMCDGENDLAEIGKALAEKTNQPVGEEIVKLAIEQLKSNNLLAESENIKDFYTKTSRRKVIKQVGLASMITLPMIFSLTAPTAASAASSCPGGAGTVAYGSPCTASCQCSTTGLCCRRSNYFGNNVVCEFSSYAPGPNYGPCLGPFANAGQPQPLNFTQSSGRKRRV